MTLNDGLWAAAVAAVATLVGYLVTQWSKRRERRTRAYADALGALRRWQEVPYLVARRQSSSPEVRAELGREMSQSASAVAFHASLLRLESDVLAGAFELLWRQKRVARSANWKDAWSRPVMKADTDVPKHRFADDDSQAEFELCILAMRRELSVLWFLTRRDTKRRIERQLALRGPALPDVPVT